MQPVIDRVMKTFGLINNLTAEEMTAAREKVSSYLAERPRATDEQLAVEGLGYLRSIREFAT
jgi:hypothetical protein